MKSTLLPVIATLLVSSQSLAQTVLYSQFFTTDTGLTSTTLSTYPEFSSSLNGDSVLVSGGVLQIAGSASTGYLYRSGFNGDFDVSLDLGASGATPGQYNVGISIGNSQFVFHPGFAGGAFRVEGPGGTSNTDMGFTPSNGVLHHLEIGVHAATGNFDIRLTDGDNSANVFSTVFHSPNYVPGDLGLGTSGNISRTAFFDNIVLVPEPQWIAISFGLGLGAFYILRRWYIKSV